MGGERLVAALPDGRLAAGGDRYVLGRYYKAGPPVLARLSGEAMRAELRA